MKMSMIAHYVLRHSLGGHANITAGSAEESYAMHAQVTTTRSYLLK